MTQPRSNFHSCRQINALAGNTLKHNLETAKHQFRIIRLEIDEMLESIELGNLERLRDDVADVLFTAYGMAARLGFPADLDFQEVCRSNFTKFDKTREDAEETAAKYLEKGVETYYTGRPHEDTMLFVTFSAKDQVGNDGKHYPKGKWLKSIHFEEPNFTPLQLEAV